MYKDIIEKRGEFTQFIRLWSEFSFFFPKYASTLYINGRDFFLWADSISSEKQHFFVQT